MTIEANPPGTADKEPRPNPFYWGYVAGWRKHLMGSCPWPLGTMEHHMWATGYDAARWDHREGRIMKPTKVAI